MLTLLSGIHSLADAKENSGLSPRYVTQLQNGFDQNAIDANENSPQSGKARERRERKENCKRTDIQSPRIAWFSPL